MHALLKEARGFLHGPTSAVNFLQEGGSRVVEEAEVDLVELFRHGAFLVLRRREVWIVVNSSLRGQSTDHLCDEIFASCRVVAGASDVTETFEPSEEYVAKLTIAFLLYDNGLLVTGSVFFTEPAPTVEKMSGF